MNTTTALAAQSPPVPNRDLAAAHIDTLTGTGGSVIDVRAIYDTDRAAPVHNRRGTLDALWPWIVELNAAGHGIFVTVNETDAEGRSRENIIAARAVWVDLDSVDAPQQYAAAAAWNPAPTFAVNSSPGRSHVYWCVEPGLALDAAETINRKLRQSFNGDPQAIDAARVLRLSGTVNHKRGDPHLVTCVALPGYGQRVAPDALEAALAGLVMQDGGTGTRHPLGTPELAAPSLDWLKRALELVDPDELDRAAWVAMTAAVKQSGWTLTDEATLHQMWRGLCARYCADDPAEDDKTWNSIRTTELGWNSLANRVPSVRAEMTFGTSPAPLPAGARQTTVALPANDSGLQPLPMSDDEWNDTSALTPPCIVDNLIFADVGTRVAAGAVGKTTTALFEAIHIALGWPLYGNLVRRPGVSCFLSSEDGRAMLIQRVRRMCEAMSLDRDQIETIKRSIRIQYVEQFKLTRVADDVVVASDGVRQVIDAFRPLSPAMIWIDPAVSFGVGESRVNDAEQGLIVAGRMIRNAIPGCAVMFIHHTGKANAREKALDQYSGRGGSALADGSRMVQVMQPLTAKEWQEATGTPLGHDETGLVLARPKLSYTPPQQPLYVRRRGWLFEAVAGQPQERRTAHHQEVFLAILRKLTARGVFVNRTSGSRYAPTVFKDDEDADGITKNKFTEAMGELLADGRIREGKVGKGSRTKTVLMLADSPANPLKE